jgi:hypothetical protein
MAVNRVTVHHEGAGSPTDYVDRFSEGGYSAGIGVSLWKRFRSPESSWGTLNYNHRSLDICLSGNRMIAVVTDKDLQLIHDAFMDFYRRGEVVAEPEVLPHRRSPGSNTVCPGNKAMDRWGAIEAACRATAPPPPPKPKPEVKVKPQYDPPREYKFVSMLRIDPPSPDAGTWGLQPDWGIITFAGPFLGTMHGNPAVAGRTPSLLVKVGTKVDGANPPLASYPEWARYECIASSGERYLPPKP